MIEGDDKYDLESKNTILDYDEWVKAVQDELMTTFGVPEGSFILKPFNTGNAFLKTWKEMFEAGTNPTAMAYFLFHAD